MSVEKTTQLPLLYRVDQKFASGKIGNVAGETARQLRESGVTLKPRATVAIAVGSRGVANVATVVLEVVAWVRGQGAEPFIVPAMGSHGGATDEGQREVLAGYGVTAAEVGAPIRSSMDAVEVEYPGLEVKGYFDRFAYHADATIVINRIKPHTDYRGPYESGLMKMIAIGLGKQQQALALHGLGLRGLRDVMPEVAKAHLAHRNLVLGVAMIENAYDETCRIQAIPARRIPEVEPGLLDYAKSCMPRLPVDEVDILVVDRMGKDISGTCLDTNIIGRLMVFGQEEPVFPRVHIIVVRDLTPGSHGNALGMGLADIITRRVFDKVDWAATYENLYTATFLLRGKTPIVAADDREAMAFAARANGWRKPGELRIVRILDTLHLGQVLVSPAILAELRGREDKIPGGVVPEWFDAANLMVPFPGGD